MKYSTKVAELVKEYGVIGTAQKVGAAIQSIYSWRIGSPVKMEKHRKKIDALYRDLKKGEKSIEPEMPEFEQMAVEVLTSDSEERLKNRQRDLLVGSLLPLVCPMCTKPVDSFSVDIDSENDNMTITVLSHCEECGCDFVATMKG